MIGRISITAFPRTHGLVGGPRLVTSSPVHHTLFPLPPHRLFRRTTITTTITSTFPINLLRHHGSTRDQELLVDSLQTLIISLRQLTSHSKQFPSGDRSTPPASNQRPQQLRSWACHLFIAIVAINSHRLRFIRRTTFGISYLSLPQPPNASWLLPLPNRHITFTSRMPSQPPAK